MMTGMRKYMYTKSRGLGACPQETVSRLSDGLWWVLEVNWWKLGNLKGKPPPHTQDENTIACVHWKHFGAQRKEEVG